MIAELAIAMHCPPSALLAESDRMLATLYDVFEEMAANLNKD